MTRIQLFSFLLIFVVLGISSPMVPAQTDAETAEKAEKAEPPKPVSYPAETPLVRYGDLEFSLGYFFMYERKGLDRLDPSDKEGRKQMQDAAVSHMIFDHLLYRQAMEQGYGNDPEFRARNRDMENEWLTAFYLYHHFDKDFTVSEEEIKKHYDEVKEEQFHDPLKYSFRHIFFQTVDRTEEEQKKAEEQVKEAMALIKAGSDFVKVAERFSESGKKGSMIGPLNTREYYEKVNTPEKAINPELEKTLLSLKVGDISDIVKTKYGYEILKLESLQPEQFTPFRQVQSRLKQTLQKQKRDEFKKKIVNDYWDEAVTEYNPDVIFEEDAAPDKTVAVIYGQTMTKSDYDFLKGRNARRQEGESTEEYQTRCKENLKENIILKFIGGKLGKDLHYDTIPRYRMITDSMRTNKVALAWWSLKSKQYMEENPVTEEEKKAFFEENQGSFLKPQKAEMAEMTFNIPPHDKTVKYEVYRAQKQASDKAREALKRVQAGEKFADVARKMSESETAKDGGVVGLIDWNSEALPKSVTREALKLDVGAVCEKPIQTDSAYYLVTVLEKPEREPMDYNDETVQTRLERAVANQKRNAYRTEVTNKMFDPEGIEILFDEFYTFNPRFLKNASLDVPLSQ